MVRAVTEVEKLATGMEIIAKNRELELENTMLRAEVTRLTVLVDMYQHCQDQEAADKAAQMDAMQQEYEDERRRELEDAIAEQEKYLYRDFTGDKYLRRIYGFPRPGKRRTWEVN